MTDFNYEALMQQMQAIRGEIQGVRGEVHGVSERMAGVETRVSYELASRTWVNEALTPLKESWLRTEHAIQALTDGFRELTADTKGLYASHDQLLKERSEREKEEHAMKLKQAEQNSWSSIIKDKWGPLLAFFIAAAAALTIINQFIQAYLPHIGVAVGK